MGSQRTSPSSPASCKGRKKHLEDHSRERWGSDVCPPSSCCCHPAHLHTTTPPHAAPPTPGLLRRIIQEAAAATVQCCCRPAHPQLLASIPRPAAPPTPGLLPRIIQKAPLLQLRLINVIVLTCTMNTQTYIVYIYYALYI